MDAKLSKVPQIIWARIKLIASDMTQKRNTGLHFVVQRSGEEWNDEISVWLLEKSVRNIVQKIHVLAFSNGLCF